MLPDFEYVRAGSVENAIRQLSSPGARLHAGGTDLLGCLRDGAFGAEKIVSIAGIAELQGITPMNDGGLRIGAMTTLAQVAAHPTITQRYAALAEAVGSVATPQLRNQGTLGGNLCQRPRCWYFRGDFHCLRKGGDTCFAVAGENDYHCLFGSSGCVMVHPSDTASALVALGAYVRIAGPKGARVIPMDSFFVLPEKDVLRENVLQRDEILTEVILPAAPSDLRSRYRKARVRRSWDFALAGVAVALVSANNRVVTARIVLSGVAPMPWRAIKAEKELADHPLNAEVISRTAKACVSDAQPLERNAYKVDLVRGIVEETLGQMKA
jgi:xanthine dehydrogenase YagS FAD-binding subunit